MYLLAASKRPWMLMSAAAATAAAGTSSCMTGSLNSPTDGHVAVDQSHVVFTPQQTLGNTPKARQGCASTEDGRRRSSFNLACAFVPVAYADETALPVGDKDIWDPDTRSSSSPRRDPSASDVPVIHLPALELAKDASSFTERAVWLAIQHQKESPLRKLLLPSERRRADSKLPLKRPPDLLRRFFGFFEGLPIREKVTVMDDIIDAMVKHASATAEIGGFTVGVLGSGLACYALYGLWMDVLAPGVGAVTCSGAAAAAGHAIAQSASQRARSNFIDAVVAKNPGGGDNPFVQYLIASSNQEKYRILSEVPAAQFFSAMYDAVRRLWMHEADLDPDEIATLLVATP